MRHIDKIGFEIEGAWYGMPRDANLIGEDSSVDIVCPDCDWEAWGCGHFWKGDGEFRSEAGDLASVENQAHANWPDLTNDTCGLHVHLSFYSYQAASLLTERAFFNALFEHLESWREHVSNPDDLLCYDKRINGHNNYCQRKHTAERQLCGKGENASYSALRFSRMTDMCEMPRTIELRSFPAFHAAEVAVKAITDYVAFVEAYLDKHLEADTSFVWKEGGCRLEATRCEDGLRLDFNEAFAPQRTLELDAYGAALKGSKLYSPGFIRCDRRHPAVDASYLYESDEGNAVFIPRFCGSADMVAEIAKAYGQIALSSHTFGVQGDLFETTSHAAV